MPRPTMRPPAGYPYSSMPPRSHPPHGYYPPHPPPEFQNSFANREEFPSYHPRYAPQFVSNKSSYENHARLHSAKSTEPPPLPPSDNTKGTASRSDGKSDRIEAKDDQDKTKKPPRPYTEYNIFFQLERERILMELEKQNQEKEGEDPLCEEEPVLNQPSDPNDVLPRPARFAHLKLLPKWYDSTHRLAESKKNKEKRKHRKTHGLVGFLELTRRIAKEWGEAEEEVKLYCRQVAKRQLGLYKEELKGWKKGQESDTVEGEKKEVDIVKLNDAKRVAPPGVPTAAAPMVERMPPLPAALAPTVAKVVKAPPPLPHVAHGTMPPPPPPPQHYPSQAIHRNISWQPHHTAYHPMNRNYPAMPVLSPSMEYHEGHRYYPTSGPHMHPLDELMHRRLVYGPRSAMVQSGPRKRKTEDQPAQPNQDNNKDLCSPSEVVIKESNTFLSPEDPDTPNDANAPITPSPSARSAGTLPQENLPMKKRRKKIMMMSGVDDFGVSDMSPGNFGASPGNGCGSSTNDSKFSPSFLSPSDMIMTPNGEAFMGQIMMQNSPSLGQWNNESPFPYIDCFSPQEGAAPSQGTTNDGCSSERGPWRGPPPSYHQPNVALMYPTSPYMPQGSQWHPNSSAMPYGISPFGANPTEEDFSDSDALELDDDEMQLMWRRLQATRAKKMRQKHALQQQQHGSGFHDSVAMQSPGGPMLQSHSNSFASPVERTEGAESGKK